MDYDQLAKEFLINMSNMHRVGPHREIRESMCGESFVLHCISLRGGDILPSEISCKMGISAARITATLNSLERKGLIIRHIDPSDRRRILIELTEAGKAESNKHQEEILNHTCEMLKKLGEHDAREYVRIIGKLAEVTQNPER